MTRHPIRRRAFLRGIGGIALALPLLDAFGDAPARARPSTAPRRFVAMFSPNGTIADAFFPTGTESSFTLGDILSPLSPHQAELIVLEGVRMASASAGPGSPHMKGIGQLLTGRPLLQGDFQSGGATSGWASGISVDQAMARQDSIRGTSQRASIELGVGVQTDDVRGRIAYAGPAEPLPPITDPKSAFGLLFGELGLSPAALAELKADRRSVLDLVKEDFDTLNPRLGAEDRRKLDAHLTTVRDIERRLDSLGTTACSLPDVPAVELSEANAPAVGKLQLDILAAALACDVTRVATFMWMYSRSEQPFPWLGITDSHHDLSHAPDTDALAKGKLIQINRWFAEQLAYLIDKLKQVPEGDGTLLDSTVILWGNELGKGNTHAFEDIPLVLAGSAGGALKTGRILRYPDRPPHNNLLVSLLNAMGVETETFGDPEHCTGPLGGLTG